MIICELTFSIGSSWIVYSGYCIPALVHPKMSLRKIFYLQARLSVLWREEGQKNDVIPSKGFLFPAYLLLAGGLELGRRVQKSDYLFAVLDVDFVACGKSLVVVFEPNHLNHIWHLGGIDGRISNGNITWLDTQHINVRAIREYQTALDDGSIILDFFNLKFLHFHTVLHYRAA